MSKTFICNMANGGKVYYDDETSHTATHFADSPQLLSLVKQFLAAQSFDQAKVFIDHNVGKVTGYSDLVEISDKDDIVYAKRINRDNYTKFVKNRDPFETSYFTILLIKDETGNYELVSTWIGMSCPSFPDDINATPESKPFWDKHALVFGSQSIQPETLTTVSPW